METERRSGKPERRLSEESSETRLTLLEYRYEQLTENMLKAEKAQKSHLILMQKLSETQREIAETLKSRIDVLESLKKNIFMLCKYTLLLIAVFGAISVDKITTFSKFLQGILK